MTVLVVGPPRSGVSALVDALRARLGVPVVEVPSGSEPPAVVVVALSANAPPTASDGALVARATAGTAGVVGAVCKIDDHRRWRAVAGRAAALVRTWTPRLADAPWIGCAAAPRVGEPEVDDLVAAVQSLLTDPDLAERNAARRRRHDDETAAVRRAARADAWVGELAGQRDALLAGRDDGGHRRLRGARLDLTRSARDRCVALRTELQDAAAQAGRSQTASFLRRAAARCREVVGEFDREVAARTGDRTGAPAPSDGAELRLPAAPRRVDGPEVRLMAVLGAGFGAGAATVVARAAAALAPGLHTVAAGTGLIAGLLLTLWLVRMRRLLAERVALHHWAGDAVAALRATLDDLLAVRLLAAGDAADTRAVERRRALADIDARLRVARLRAAEVRAAVAGVWDPPEPESGRRQDAARPGHARGASTTRR